MEIICENEYCIYQENNKCMLDKIEIDGTGYCAECIYPGIPREYLEYEKAKLRKKFAEEDGEEY